MKRILIVLVLAAIGLSACGLALQPTAALTATPYPTNTSYPTYTPYPTVRPTLAAAPILAAPDVIAQGWEALGLTEWAEPIPGVPNGRFFSGNTEANYAFGAIVVDEGNTVEVTIYSNPRTAIGLLGNMMLATGVDASTIDIVYAMDANTSGWLHPDSLTIFVEVEEDYFTAVTIIVTGNAAWPTPLPGPSPMPTPVVTATTRPTATERPTPAPRTSFGDGVWLVGTDIAPGTYRTQHGDRCWWERLSCFDGTHGCIIAYDYANNVGASIVEIRPSDAGFSSDNCGQWSLLP